MMKVLIVKTSSMGDIVHAFPVLGYIKAKFPDAQIDWVVEKASLPLVQSHPDVRQAIAIDTKQWRKHLFSQQTYHGVGAFKRQLQQESYDVVFDLQGNSKSGLMTWLAKSLIKVGFGKNRVPEWPNLLATNRRYAPPVGGSIRADYLHLVQSHFQDFSSFPDAGVRLKLSENEQDQLEKAVEILKRIPGNKVMVCPGSNWKNKQLSKETLLFFLQELALRHPCHFVFVWGSKDEYHHVQALADLLKQATVLEKMSLPLLQNVMQEASVVVAMDSIALHLAATTAIPTFSVFGASLASKYKPLGSQHIAIQGSCPYGETFHTRCPKLRSCPTGACIRTLTAKDLLDAWQSVISSTSLLLQIDD